MDYSNLGLDKHFRAINSLTNKPFQNIKDYIDRRVDDITRPGGLSFQAVKNTAMGYQAVVSKDNAGGAFTNIQDAINYVNSIGGGKVFISRGTYNVTSPINIYSNTEVVGEGRYSTVIDFGSTVAGFYLGTSRTDIYINNMTLQNSWGTSNSALGTDGAISGRLTERLKIENILFKNNKDGNGNGYDINCAQGIFIEVDSCIGTNSANFFVSRAAGVTSNRNGPVTISNCEIYCYGKAIWGQDNGTANNGINNLKLSDNRIVGINPGLGTFILGGKMSNCRVINNYFEDSHGTAGDSIIHLSGGTLQCTDLLFQGNVITTGGDNGKEAITIGTYGSNFRIHFVNNQFSVSPIGNSNQINITGQTYYSSFIGNYISQSGTNRSINLVSSAGTNVIVGNILVGGTATISDASSGNIIANNATA